nr:MAG TPA: hypothetical protein [Caudoviricetes sp.]
MKVDSIFHIFSLLARHLKNGCFFCYGYLF